MHREEPRAVLDKRAIKLSIAVVACMMSLLVAQAMIVDLFHRDSTVEGIKGTLGSNDLVVRTPILIVGDGELDAFCANNGTDGTASYPYVVSGFNVDATGSRWGISLVNTTRHVLLDGHVIQNNAPPFASFLNSAGILLINASNVVVSGCTFQSNSNGISVSSSHDVVITNNTIIDSFFCGLAMNDSSNVIVTCNTFWNCGAFVLGSLAQLLSLEIDTTNKVNTRGSIHYIKDVSHVVLDHIADESQVFIVHCKGVEVRGIDFGSSSVGLMVFYSEATVVQSNEFDSITYGIACVGSNGTIIRRNRVTGAFYGIGINTCNDTLVEYNVVHDNTWDGIVISHNVRTSIRNNDVRNNPQFNVKVVDSNHTSIVRNTITGGGRGIGLAWNDVNVTVSGNHISSAEQGIEIDQSRGIIVSSNQVSSCSDYGLKIGTSSADDIAIYLNNFVSNSPDHVLLQSGTNVTWNGTRWGNFWDDYTARFPNATHVDNITWDIPYTCNWTALPFTDYRPLVTRNAIPWATIHVSERKVPIGSSVSFTAIGALGDSPVAFRWDFGDGHVSDVGPAVHHAYAEPGVFTVSLLMEDIHGETCFVAIVDSIEVIPAVDGGIDLYVVFLILVGELAIAALLSTVLFKQRRGKGSTR